MNKHFEVATKVNKTNNMNSIENEKWDILAEDIPSLSNGKGYVIIKSAEDIMIPSIWKGFLGAANTGINMVANKLNSLFGSSQDNYDKTDYNEAFKPVIVHTGLKVIMPDDEVLVLHNFNNGETGSIISNGTQLVVDDVEITISMYNMFGTDILIKKGQPIAVGIFQKVITNSTDKIDLSK